MILDEIKKKVKHYLIVQYENGKQELIDLPHMPYVLFSDIEAISAEMKCENCKHCGNCSGYVRIEANQNYLDYCSEFEKEKK